VEEVKTFESQQKKGRHYFCAEFTVLSTTSQDYAPGDRVSWLVNMDQPSALSNIKGFALALSDEVKESEIDEEAMDQLISSDNPAAGAKVKATAYNVQTRSGGDFTKVSWVTMGE
jgi:dihydrofolate reductase